VQDEHAIFQSRRKRVEPQPHQVKKELKEGSCGKIGESWQHHLEGSAAGCAMKKMGTPGRCWFYP